MAEIEVVSEGGGGRRDEDEERRRRQEEGAGQPADPVVDVYSAAAYGDLERLRGFVEQGGPAAAALREPDGNGYHALQWAALNNYPHVALYIIEVGLGLRFPCRYPASYSPASNLGLSIPATLARLIASLMMGIVRFCRSTGAT